MEYYAIDRIEGNYAVCEKDGENFIFHLDENFDKISSVKCNACPIWSVWKYFAIEFDGREYACINDDYYDAITGEHYYLSRIQLHLLSLLLLLIDVLFVIHYPAKRRICLSTNFNKV